jgi:dTDP-4-amino-4,6-dideoxygalactose transaminase
MAPYAPAAGLPATERLAATHLALPISPVLRREQVAEVTAAVSAALGAPVPS